MSRYFLQLASAAFVAVTGATARAACPSPLVNNTTADATQVMAWLDCKASLDTSVSFNGIQLGTGGDRGLNITENYASFGETDNGATTVLGNNVKVTDGVANTVEVSASAGDPSHWIALTYSLGFSFHAHSAAAVGTQFSAYSGELMRISPNGNVGIGTSAPSQKLEVSGYIRQSGCTTTTTLSATTSGDIICTASDARLKDIYGRYNGGLREIARIVPVRFRYKQLPGNPTADFEHAGFIAQDIMNIIPQAVARQKNGYYALDTIAILAASVNAIKELKMQNDEQAAELERLSKQLAAERQLHIRIEAIAAELAALKRQRLAGTHPVREARR